MDVIYRGLDPAALATLFRRGVDHVGNPVVPLDDVAGGWPLRCCLRDSPPGERIAIVGFSPFAWNSPHRTTGPVVVHALRCGGASGGYPSQFDGRDQVVRAFGRVGPAGGYGQVYDRNRLVRAGEGLPAVIADILADPRVDSVQAYNVLAGCYSFTAIAA